MPSKPTRKLTKKQQVFVAGYLKGDTKKAAAKAGISYIYARQLLTFPIVQAAIAEKQDKFIEKVRSETDIDREWLIKQYKKINDFDIRKVYDEKGRLKPIIDLDADTAYAITGIKAESRKEMDGEKKISVSTRDIRSIDKKGALDSIGKIIGAFELDNSQQGKEPAVTNIHVHTTAPEPLPLPTAFREEGDA